MGFVDFLRMLLGWRSTTPQEITQGGTICDVAFRVTVMHAPQRETRCDAPFRATVVNVSERGPTA